MDLSLIFLLGFYWSFSLEILVPMFLFSHSGASLTYRCTDMIGQYDLHHSSKQQDGDLSDFCRWSFRFAQFLYLHLFFLLTTCLDAILDHLLFLLLVPLIAFRLMSPLPWACLFSWFYFQSFSQALTRVYQFRKLKKERKKTDNPTLNILFIGFVGNNKEEESWVASGFVDAAILAVIMEPDSFYLLVLPSHIGFTLITAFLWPCIGLPTVTSRTVSLFLHGQQESAYISLLLLEQEHISHMS